MLLHFYIFTLFHTDTPPLSHIFIPEMQLKKVWGRDSPQTLKEKAKLP